MEIGEGLFQYRLVGILGIGNASDAVEILAIGYILTVYGNVSALQQSTMTAAVFVGMLFGGIGFGRYSDQAGRRKSLLWSLLLNGIGALLASFSYSVNSFIICRVLAGVGVGGSIPCLFTLCVEHLQDKRRGFYVAIVASFWMLGSICTAGMAWWMLADREVASWRIFSAFTSIPAWSCLWLTWWYVPESPRFLASMGKMEEADEVLKGIQKVNGMQRTPLLGNRIYLKQMQEDRMNQGSMLDVVLDPWLRQPTILLCIMWFGLSFGSYGLATWIALLFQRIGLENPYGNAFLYALANLPGNLFSACFVDSFGRKGVLVISLAMASLCALIFALEIQNANSVVIITCACLFNMFSISSWNVLDVLSAESYPTNIRTTAMGLLTAMGRLGSISAQFINGYLMAPPVHIATLLTITSIVMCITCGAAICIRQETKGIPLRDYFDKSSTSPSTK